MIHGYKKYGMSLLLLIMLTGVGNYAYTDSMTPSLKDRVQRLEDIESIRTLLVEYGRDLDKRDLVAYSHLFADDGIWEGGMGKAQSPKAIEKLVRDGFSKLPPRHNDFHLMTSMDIKITGPHSATAWSRWTYVVQGEDGKPTPLLAGHYEDTLTKVNGAWKFQHRHAYTDVK